MLNDVESELCAPFVFDVIEKCMIKVKEGLGQLAILAPLTETNIVEMSGWRGNVIAPLTFLMLVDIHYPEIVANMFGRSDALTPHLSAARLETNMLANNIANMIGRPEAAELASPTKPDDANSWKGFTLMILEMSKNISDMCISEIEAEGEITSGAKLVRVHGANCCLASTLACVANVVGAPNMLQSIGLQVETIADHYAMAADFSQNTVNRIKAMGPKPH